MSNYFSESDLDDLMYSPEYAEFIMERAGGDRPIYNGDMLTQLQEEGYMFDEFVEFMERKLKAIEYGDCMVKTNNIRMVQ